MTIGHPLGVTSAMRCFSDKRSVNGDWPEETLVVSAMAKKKVPTIYLAVRKGSSYILILYRAVWRFLYSPGNL